MEIAIIGPPKKPVYDVFDKEGIKKVTKLYVNFSALNEHRFPHNFECNSPTCMCGRGIEGNKHVLLHCNQFNLMHRDLFRNLTVPSFDINVLDSDALQFAFV